MQINGTTEALADLLHSIGWRSPCDAQWSHLDESLPLIAAMVGPLDIEQRDATAWRDKGYNGDPLPAGATEGQRRAWESGQRTPGATLTRRTNESEFEQAKIDRIFDEAIAEANSLGKPVTIEGLVEGGYLVSPAATLSPSLHMQRIGRGIRTGRPDPLVLDGSDDDLRHVMARTESLLDPKCNLLSIPYDSATVVAARRDMDTIRKALAAAVRGHGVCGWVEIPDIVLPIRPAAQWPATDHGEPDKYSGIQMLQFGRQCAQMQSQVAADLLIPSAPVMPADAVAPARVIAWRALDGHGLSFTDWIDGDPGEDAQSACVGGRIERAYSSAPAPELADKPAAWVNGERLAELGQQEKLLQLWLRPSRSDEDDTALYTRPAIAQAVAPAAPKYDCCANCMRPQAEHNGKFCPPPFSTWWHAWEYDFAPNGNYQPAAKADPAPVQDVAPADAQFLIDRLDDFANQPMSEDNERDWQGHVAPALARFRAGLLPGLAEALACDLSRPMVDMVPPATHRDRWMFEQGRLAERDPRTPADAGLITASLMIDDSHNDPAYCLMAAFRSEAAARAAHAVLTGDCNVTCRAGAVDGIGCPPDSCDIDDGVRASPGAYSTGDKWRDPALPAEAQGLFRKYQVSRLDGADQPGRKHSKCRLFVLDLDHDLHARRAALAYALSCYLEIPQLSADLLEMVGGNDPQTEATMFWSTEHSGHTAGSIEEIVDTHFANGAMPGEEIEVLMAKRLPTARIRLLAPEADGVMGYEVITHNVHARSES